LRGRGKTYPWKKGHTDESSNWTRLLPQHIKCWLSCLITQGDLIKRGGSTKSLLRLILILFSRFAVLLIPKAELGIIEKLSM
jgi:hypothetical protein